MRVVFVYEELFPPFDEGIKNFANMIYKSLSEEHDVKLVRDIEIFPRIVNSILLIPRVLLKAGLNSDRIVFVPKGALTLVAWIKAWIFSAIYGNRLAIVHVQRRELDGWKRFLASKMRLSRVYVMSKAMKQSLEDKGVNASVIISGIDRQRFRPTQKKELLRAKYSIPIDKRVVLHVGHIRESRNVNWLKIVQMGVEDTQVVLVGSTSTTQDTRIYDELVDAGIIVIREALAEIQEIYQLADCYCFPVIKTDAAMETPLSVFEAMSANLPVVTTRFGLLPDIFEQDECYVYVSSSDELLEVIKRGFPGICNNRNKTKSLTWRAAADRLIKI